MVLCCTGKRLIDSVIGKVVHFDFVFDKLMTTLACIAFYANLCVFKLPVKVDT